MCSFINAAFEYLKDIIQTQSYKGKKIIKVLLANHQSLHPCRHSLITFHTINLLSVLQKAV